MSQSWKTDENGLYVTVTNLLPAFRTRRGNLDVPRMSDEIGKSEESIYKWFRRSNLLSMDNAREIVRLSNGVDNILALAAANRRPPTVEDLIRFL